MRRLLMLFSAVLFTAFTGARESEAATIGVDSGWLGSQIDATSDLIPFDFTLTTAGVFSLTDCCNLGDTWTITGDIVGASSVGLAAIAIPLFGDVYDSYWVDAAYSHFQAALGAGSYSIWVSGDGRGGIPAGFAVRVDTAAVPLPAAGLLLAGALAGLGALSRRRKLV